MINNNIKVIIEIISFIVLIVLIYNHNKIYNLWRQRRLNIVKKRLESGDRYIEKINKLTGYKG